MAIRQLAPVRPPTGYAMLFPTKFCGPIDTRDTRKDVLEKSAFIIVSPSATMVPLPIVVRYGVSCPTSVPKLDPVCSTWDRS